MTVDCRVLVAASCLTVLISAYYTNVKDELKWPDDPEPKLIDKLPTEESMYKNTTAGAESLGSLFAGTTEFPYLVDVRLMNRDQEDWTVGGLLSHKAVLTTCRWSRFYLKATREHYVDYGKPEIKERWRQNDPELVVFYAPLYLHDRRRLWTEFWDKPVSREKQGSRAVKFIASHPKCEEDGINYDFSLLTLARDIPPLIPYIAYMPIYIERDQLLMTDFDLSHHENKHIICYIASFGRNYANWKFHMTESYKVKYRVYFEDWAACASQFDKYRCPREDVDYPAPPGEKFTAHHCPGPILDQSVDEFSKGYENLMCFNSRARVGSVCDHDNGGQLVCDGKVFGIVARGAHFKFCNDLLPVPFIVSKITPAADYYMNLARKPYTFSLEVDSDDSSRSKRALANMVKVSTSFTLFSATVFIFHVIV